MAAVPPFRVVLTHQGASRKFFTLFQGKDGSLYIHPYRPPGEPWRVPGGDDPIGPGTRLDFSNFREPQFELHKISFHPSGVIHLTDRAGSRFRDGVKGPSFEEMASPYMLCVLAPPDLHRLPEVDNSKKVMTTDLVLPDDIQPFYLTLSLASGEVSAPAGALLTLVLPLEDGRKLVMSARPVGLTAGATTAAWPPFPFFLLRTAP